MGRSSPRLACSEALTRSHAVRRVCHIFTDTSSVAGPLCYRLRCQPAIRRRPVERSPDLGGSSLSENSAGLPERSAICAEARSTMEIYQQCANEAAGSFELILARFHTRSVPYANTSGHPRFLPGQRSGSLAVDSWSRQKVQGGEDEPRRDLQSSTGRYLTEWVEIGTTQTDSFQEEG